MNKFISILFLFLFVQQANSVDVILTNQNGRTFEGDLKRVSNNRVSLDVDSDGGIASLYFNLSDVRVLEFLDEEIAQDGVEAWEAGQFEAAAELLASVHRNRSPFLSLFPELEITQPSLAFAHAQIELGHYPEAAGIAANLMRATTANGRLESQAEDLLLLAFYKMNRFEDARLIAERWVETRQPQFDSALGWWILGEIYLEEQNPVKARWLALQPITFSSQFPKDYLEECYQVVIASWLMEGEDAQAIKLYQEFNDRMMEWPESTHQETKTKLNTLLLELKTEMDKKENPLEIEEGAPEKDLNLPIESIRKLTTKTQPTP